MEYCIIFPLIFQVIPRPVSLIKAHSSRNRKWRRQHVPICVWADDISHECKQHKNKGGFERKVFRDFVLNSHLHFQDIVPKSSLPTRRYLQNYGCVDVVPYERCGNQKCFGESSFIRSCLHRWKYFLIIKIQEEIEVFILIVEVLETWKIFLLFSVYS